MCWSGAEELVPDTDEHPSGIMPLPGHPVEERHIEAGVRFMAYVVVRRGEAYAPIFERLEAELAEIRRRRSPADRARMLLSAHTLDGGLKAIR